MSENKNGQGAQWSKSAVTAAAVTAAAIAAAAQKQQHQQHIQHQTLYNATALSLTSPAPGTSSALYGGSGHLGSHQTSEIPSYAAARFQAPPIDHRSSSSLSSHIVPSSPSSTTNVPVPSGFIPPPFSPAAGAATSVLTPNPFAVASLAAAGASHSSASSSQSHTLTHPPSNQQFSGPHQVPASHHAHFGMEQFQHLNVQQQYELGKIMAASFSTNQQIVDSTGPTNLSSNTPSLLSSAQPASTIPPTTGTSVCHTSTTIRHPPPSTPSCTETSSSGNINSQMAEQVISVISTGSSASKMATTPIHGRLMGLGVHAPDEEKLRRIQQVVESGIGDHAKQQIVQILDRISNLRPVEKLLLYLRLPGEQPETDPLRQPQNPLGTRSEINHTINWVRTHLEQDPQVSIPKQDVYNDYLIYCDRLDIKPLSTADFGKVMKQVFPGIRPRRLGTRGHSRYCYAAMRKTSKLPAPHLPTLSTLKTSKDVCEKDGSIDLSTNIIDSTEEQEESWSVVKQWAETMLHVKIDNISDLATHIKSSGSLPLAVGGTHTPYTGSTRGANSGVTHKKLAQREPKEKRAMADIGPLKKRRKKKRKGSSSSESSCHQNLNSSEQQQIQTQLSPANSSKSGSLYAVLSPAIEDGQKVKIKQEVLDSPGYSPSVGSMSGLSQSTELANAPPQYQTSTIGTNTLKMAQHQVMPMNLAAETRGGISNVLASRVPSTTASYSTSAFEHVRPSSTNTTTTAAAVKNLTPKLMELSTENQAISSPPSQTIIKQEIGTEDYNTSNIFCKKVRKAQQTKGFWANLPTPSRSTAVTAPTTSFPIITTTASTPPPIPASVISTPSNNTDSVVVYNMGPPTQMAPSTSPSSQSVNDDVNSLAQPKVLSRNLQQLKAKKLLAAAAAAAGSDPHDLSAAKDAADLPANLGLPRERVISICNMDKHELDDYFLPVEEENSEDQETELLQYFQMGDAEEKLTKNSSSDAKRNSNSTVNTSTSISKTTTSTIGVELSSNLTTTTSKISTSMMMSTYKSKNNTPSINDIVTNSRQVQNGKTQQSFTVDYPKSTTITTTTTTITNSLNKLQQISSCLTATTSSSCLNTVVTASASLAQLTQKHQQQMQQPQQPQQHQHQLLQKQQHKTQSPLYSKVSIKRKINLNTRNTTSEITAARKNYSFLPISPNINSTSSNQTLMSLTYNNSNNSGSGFFASPGLSRLLTKQQSLDSDSTSDPMIGATRRLRSYNSMMTSASAPPSPSILKQQQEQQMFSHMTHNMLLDQWSPSTGPFNNPSAAANATSSIMGDQNSLDLDLFGEAAAAAASTATSASFSNRTNFNMGINNNSEGIMINNADSLVNQINDLTQRSQSVPLSQLQRSHSPTFNRSFHCDVNNTTAVSACNSLAQTPVPSEFMDSVTMLSENSCSQQSATIKIEEVANVVASDTTAILDEVDVSEILSSPDFVASLNQSCTTKTTCSSAGSSSGYSSTGHFSLSSVNYNIGGCGSGAGSGAMSSSISRSVPSTPLPHQNPQSLFGNNNNFYRRRFINNCQNLNGSVVGGGVLDNLNTFSNSFLSTGKYVYGNISSSLSRSACDISKSMPSTPITTTPSSFRYSPSEFTRDFLINGNTIDDSITSSFGAVGADNLMGSDVVGVDVPLNSESLLNDEDTLINGSAGMSQVENDVLTPDFSVQTETSGPCLGGVVGESSVVIGVNSDLLDNL